MKQTYTVMTRLPTESDLEADTIRPLSDEGPDVDGEVTYERPEEVS
jgi:hypothetical protein